MIVAFEGMDGSGKSTIAQAVAEKENFRYEPQRLISLLNIDEEKFNKFIKLIRTSKNKKLAFFFYSFRCMLDNDIKEDTVVERTMMSTYYFEKNKILEEEWDSIMTNNIVPDITFVLYASSYIRQQRIKKRNKNDSDLKSSEALKDGYPTMLEFANKYDIPYVGINTEIYNKQQIVEICSAIIFYYSRIPKEARKKFIKRMNDTYGFDSLYLLGEEKKYEKKL